MFYGSKEFCLWSWWAPQKTLLLRLYSTICLWDQQNINKYHLRLHFRLPCSEGLCAHEWFLIWEKGHTAIALLQEVQEEPAPGLSRLLTTGEFLAVISFVVVVWSLSHVRLFCDPWTVACQVPLFIGFFQTRVWEWVAISSSRGSSRPGAHLWNLLYAGGFFTAGPPGKPLWYLHFSATAMLCCFTVINCRFVITHVQPCESSLATDPV